MKAYAEWTAKFSGVWVFFLWWEGGYGGGFWRNPKLDMQKIFKDLKEKCGGRIL